MRLGLNDSCLIFYYPFICPELLDRIEYDSLIWKLSDRRPIRDYVEPGIFDFFGGISEKKPINLESHQGILFKIANFSGIKSEKNGYRRKKHFFLWQNLFSKTQTVWKKNKVIFRFKIVQKDSNLGPSLFYNPELKAGILTFAIVLFDGDQNLQNLMLANNLLSRLGNKFSYLISIPKSQHPNAQPKTNKISDYLIEQCGWGPVGRPEYFDWNITHLLQYLLLELEPKEGFTLTGTIPTLIYGNCDSKLDEKNWNSLAHIMARKGKYSPSPLPVDTLSVIKSIRVDSNIYSAIAKEGVSILVEAPPVQSTKFHQQYTFVVQNGYFWNFLLVALQHFYLEVAQKNLASDPEQFESYVKVLNGCMFDSFSSSTIQTEFYNGAREVLKIEKRFSYFDSLKPKQSELGLVSTSFESKNTPKNGRPKILFLAANSVIAGGYRLRLDKEKKKIIEALRILEEFSKYEWIDIPDAEITDLENVILRVSPSIIHFSGHGKAEGIAFMGPGENAEILKKNHLGNLIHSFLSPPPECIILNSCFSMVLSEELRNSTRYLIGSESQIDDHVAIEFSDRFYTSLEGSNSIEKAYKMARHSLMSRNFRGWQFFKMYKEGKEVR